MDRTEAAITREIADVLDIWHGIPLPPGVAGRIGPDFAALIAGFRALPPVPFDVQAHDFGPLLESLADD